MPEATSKRNGSDCTDPVRANEPPAKPQPEPDRDVENYRDEYDLPKPDRPKDDDDQRSKP